MKQASVQPTGIQALDTMLHGGLPSGSTVLLSGKAGAGKTILATQWLCEGSRQYAEAGIYFSMTEPQAKLLSSLSSMSYFDRSTFEKTNGMHIVDFRSMLESLGLSEQELDDEKVWSIADAFAEYVITYNAKRVVIDSITAIAYLLRDPALIRAFMFRFGSMLAALEASVLMTSEVASGKHSVFGIEEFIVDGIIHLTYEREEYSLNRTLSIVKMRNCAFDSHPASVNISEDGITILPRYNRALKYATSNDHISTGVDGLDAMMSGGYLQGSSILITGASGTGKSIAALHFILAGLQLDETCLLVSFEESRNQIMRNAASFEWDLASYEEQNRFHMLCKYPEEMNLEEHMSSILTLIDNNKPTRVVIDSVSSLMNVYKEDHAIDFCSRIAAALKRHGVTTLFTAATDSLIGPTTLSQVGLSAMTDTIVMLRYVEVSSQLRHALLILKMRGSHHDKSLRELQFSNRGIVVSTDFSGYEGVISGMTRKVKPTVQEKIHDLFLEILGPIGEQVFAEQEAKGLSHTRISTLISKLTDEGVLSTRQQEEFQMHIDSIFGIQTE